MRNFKNLDIWKQGIELVKLIYFVSEKLPSEERFGLRSQITRASVSIPSNIAEGASRNSEAEFKRAIGSLFEVETQLTIIEELGFIESQELKPLFELLEKEAKMINSLINKLKAKS
ncbi:four helix bundle protein [Tenacibaculum sp. IB213877]|uniref:four helix bundle protein n=1 Tax=Tenacibaculum sp. IB213877 TaxID=3097351 RepID=UPI002A5ACA32|nr:four helix bundle protein [Tenacibaculum sp. IB213877]MDY0779791.1 four helix bundle protein [Tenacibaculum sp. IB213877]